MLMKWYKSKVSISEKTFYKQFVYEKFEKARKVTCGFFKFRYLYKIGTLNVIKTKHYEKKSTLFIFAIPHLGI